MQAEGGNGRENDVGCDDRRRNAARGVERVAEAGGGGCLWVTSSWTAFRASKGGG